MPTTWLGTLRCGKVSVRSSKAKLPRGAGPYETGSRDYFAAKLALWNSSWIICYQWLAGNFLGSWVRVHYSKLWWARIQRHRCVEILEPLQNLRIIGFQVGSQAIRIARSFIDQLPAVFHQKL